MRTRIFLGLLLLLSTIGISSAATTTLVANGSSWKYFIGQAEASNPQTAWRSIAFNAAVGLRKQAWLWPVLTLKGEDFL